MVSLSVMALTESSSWPIFSTVTVTGSEGPPTFVDGKSISEGVAAILGAPRPKETALSLERLEGLPMEQDAVVS